MMKRRDCEGLLTIGYCSPYLSFEIDEEDEEKEAEMMLYRMRVAPELGAAVVAAPCLVWDVECSFAASNQQDNNRLRHDV